jgi:hypothetical protein
MAEDRTYFRVHDGMDEHPKIAPLSDAAFRLIVETWAYCSRNRTDGRLTDAVWRKRGKPKARRELEALGLVEQHDGYVQVHDYLDWQRSAAEIDEYIEKKRRASVKGTHVRYHVGEGRPDPGCPLCADGGRPPGSSHPASQDDSHQTPEWESHPASQVASHLASRAACRNGAQRQRQRQIPRTTSGGDVAETDARATPSPFPDHCPAHAHIPVPPACGRCKETREHNRRRAPQLPDYRLRVVPPLCGQCDDRWIDTAAGYVHCPRCHPAEVRTA